MKDKLTSVHDTVIGDMGEIKEKDSTEPFPPQNQMKAEIM